MQAYCNKCGITCGDHAIGQSCSNNDGGKIIGVNDPAPATFSQLKYLSMFRERTEFEGICQPAPGVTEFKMRFFDHGGFGPIGRTVYIYLTDDAQMMGNIEVFKRQRTERRKAHDSEIDKEHDFPILVRLFPNYRDHNFGSKDSDMIEEEFPENRMVGLVGHDGARDRARRWVRDERIRKLGSKSTPLTRLP